MTQSDMPGASSRYLPLSGAAYTALLVLGAVSFPAPPGGDVAAAGHPAWLAVHTDAVIEQSYVRALAALAFISFAVAVAAACRRALPRGSAAPVAALTGGILAGALMLLAQAAGLAAALFVHTGGSADATRALGALQNGMLDMSSVPAVLLFAATGIAGLRTGFVPRWLAVLSLVGVPLALLDAASYDGGPFAALSLLGLAYFLVWSLVTGVRLYLAAGVTSSRGSADPRSPRVASAPAGAAPRR